MKFLKFSKLFYVSSFFVLFSLVLIFSSIVYATNDWTEPSVDPPRGNIDFPLNQGATPQYKEGPLTIGSGVVVSDGYLFKVIAGSSLFETLDISKFLNVGTDAQIKLVGINSKINLTDKSSINLNNSSINLTNGATMLIDYANIDTAFYLEHTGSNGTGIYSSVKSDSGTAIYGESIKGNSVFGLTQGGVGIFGSTTGSGLAGRFDGGVRFNDITKSKYVEIDNGHILVQSGFSTIAQPEFPTTQTNVYRNNTVATKNLCFYNKDSEGNYLNTLDCRDEFTGGPASENFFIWNVGRYSDFESLQQTADINLDGLISVKCNDGGVQANPTKGIKVGEGSYLYDSSCDAGGGEIPDTTLHMQSAETINIGSNPAIASGLVVLKVTNASNSLLTVLGSGNVGIGATTPAAKLHVNGGIYLDSITTPSPTTNRLYNTGGNLFWNGMQLNISQANHWILNGTNLYTTSTIQRVGIGTTTPQSQLHVNGGIYLTPTTTQFAENILFNNSNGDLVWKGGMILSGSEGPELANTFWQPSMNAPWGSFTSSNGQSFNGSNGGGGASNNAYDNPAIYGLAYLNGGIYLEQGRDYIFSFNASGDTSKFHFGIHLPQTGLDQGNNRWTWAYPVTRTYTPRTDEAPIHSSYNNFSFTPSVSGTYTPVFYSTYIDGNISISNFSAKFLDPELAANISVTGLYTGVGSEGIKVSPLGYVGIGTSAPAAELHVDGDAIITGSLCLGSSCTNDLRLQCPPRMVPVKIDQDLGSFGYIIYEDCNNRTYSDRVIFTEPQICNSIDYTCKYLQGAQYANYSSYPWYGTSLACESLCKTFGLKINNPTSIIENIDFTDDKNYESDPYWCYYNDCYNGAITSNGTPSWNLKEAGYWEYTSKLMSCTCYRKSINE